jgi:hypothetical protein
MDSIKKKLPTNCPSCGEALKVKRLRCEACETEVEGLYQLPALARLPLADQEFVLKFISASGSLKEMAKLMKVSYPTVRNRLNEIIHQLSADEEATHES